MEEKIQVKKRFKAKPKDVYLTIMVRKRTIKDLDQWAICSQRSRNELINIFLDYGLKNIELID